MCLWMGGQEYSRQSASQHKELVYTQPTSRLDGGKIDIVTTADGGGSARCDDEISINQHSMMNFIVDRPDTMLEIVDNRLEKADIYIAHFLQLRK